MTASQIKDSFFQIGEKVVYPSYGVGLIEAEEEEEIAGNKMSFFVVVTIKNKVTLRVPKKRAAQAGLRHLSSKKELEEALEILKQKPVAKKSNWPKLSQDYNSKINSGKPTLIATVARDCYEGSSYSEKTLCKEAISRLAIEYALALGLEEEAAEERILSILKYKI
jgi:CarD family transcriptional regulator